MSRGAFLTTRLFVVILFVLLASACGRSREEATPTPLPPTEAELAAMNTPTPTTGDAAADAEVVAAETNAGNTVTTASGLQYTEVRAGSGPKPQPGEVVAVHYTGRLADGTVFDSSRERGEPIRFPIGVGYVIPGWDEGIAMMNQGGQATLVVPPELGYGADGFGDVIPANATLTFDVELLEIAPGAPAAPTAVDESQYTTTEQGIKYVDLVAGEGPVVNNGQLVVVHYTGWLEDGTKFDSSLDRGEPYTFNLGMGQVIAGWDLGLRGMKVGATRQLVIPAELAYGESGYGGVIPPNAPLIFEIQLLEAQ